MLNRLLLMVSFALALTGCTIGTSTPTPSPLATAAPVVVLATATTEPTLTPLPPPVTVLVMATTAVPPSNTPAPMETVTPTATSTRIPVTRPPRTATPTAVVLKYPAPQLVKPDIGSTLTARKDDIDFRWKPVANLDKNECYEVVVRVTNLLSPGQRYGQQAFLASDTCNSTTGPAYLRFVLYAKRHGTPHYEGLIDDADAIDGPGSTYQVDWWVRVVQDQGPRAPDSTIHATIPISQDSAHYKLILQSP